MPWYKNKVELPSETVYEMVVAADGQGFGLAVVDIVKSEPHYHIETREEYTLVSGALRVHLDDTVVVLSSFGASVIIPPFVTHWAESMIFQPARIIVTTTPAWSSDDHYLAKTVNIFSPRVVEE